MFKYIYKYQKTGDFFRPIIPISLRSNDEKFSYLALIDSGADFNVFHTGLAESLKIGLTDSERVQIYGIKEGEPALGFLKIVEIGIKPYEQSDSAIYFKAPIVFSNNISNDGYGIVGQIGFFNFFKVKMDYMNKHIELERKDPLP